MSSQRVQRGSARSRPRIPGRQRVLIELAPILRTLFSLGLWERPWRKVQYPEHPGVGNIEADFFQPDAWRPEYPNPAFERMQDEDAFWAAAIVHEFSDDAVRAAVATGELGNAESERYLVDTLIRRRDKTVAHYFARTNPLAWFAVEGGALRFRNLGEESGLGRVEGYDVEWSEFDNTTGRPCPSHLPLPSPFRPVPFHSRHRRRLPAARIRTRSAPARVDRAVTVYLRRGAGWEVVIDRLMTASFVCHHMTTAPPIRPRRSIVAGLRAFSATCSAGRGDRTASLANLFLLVGYYVLRTIRDTLSSRGPCRRGGEVLSLGRPAVLLSVSCRSTAGWPPASIA